MTIRKSMFQLVNAYASKVEGNELGTSVTFTDEKLATSPARGPKPPTATGGDA